MIEVLGKRDSDWVEAYLATGGDAVEACRRTNLGPREANKIYDRLKPHIEAAKVARGPADEGASLTPLERAMAAYALAEREGNAPAMVSSAQLIARLQGVLDGGGEVAIVDSPAFAKVQGAILRALADYPAARMAVVAALHALDSDESDEAEAANA